MENNPLVSVIIPTYKRPKKLKRALKSVLNQTYENLEIIVVNDDPATDIDNIINFDDDRIVPINHDKNKGAPAARNTGIINSYGKYIAFLDDDDEWQPKKIEKQIKKFSEQNPSYGVVYNWYELVSKEHKRIVKPEMEGNIHLDLLNRNFGSTSLVLISKDVFDDIGLFDEKLKSAQEWDLWLRISKKYKFSYVPEVLTKIYQTHSDRISLNADKKIKGWKRIMDKYESEFEKHPSILSEKYKTKGFQLASMGADREFCSELFKKSYTYGNREFMSIIYLAMSQFPNGLRKYFFKKIMNHYRSSE